MKKCNMLRKNGTIQLRGNNLIIKVLLPGKGTFRIFSQNGDESYSAASAVNALSLQELRLTRHLNS